MARPGSLSNPPVREALIDVRVLPMEIARFESDARQRFGTEYPRCDYQREYTGTIRFPQEGSPSAEARAHGVVGLALRTQDGRRVLQLQNNGFTFNVLDVPYPGWNAFFSEVQRLWQQYVEIVKPISILRVAVRYINRLELPITADFEFEKYLETSPRIPATLPQQMSEFLTKVVIPYDSEGRCVILAQSLELPVQRDYLQITLDIDAFRSVNRGVSKFQLFEELEKLRLIKNSAFFGALTDHALEPHR